jgi:hypothetical protein
VCFSKDPLDFQLPSNFWPWDLHSSLQKVSSHTHSVSGKPSHRGPRSPVLTSSPFSLPGLPGKAAQTTQVTSDRGEQSIRTAVSELGQVYLDLAPGASQREEGLTVLRAWSPTQTQGGALWSQSPPGNGVDQAGPGTTENGASWQGRTEEPLTGSLDSRNLEPAWGSAHAFPPRER